MKSIKDAAIEFEKTNGQRIYYEAIETNPDSHLCMESFKSGVEFAQRWISVDEELPPVGKVVLLKYDNDYTQITTGVHDSKKFMDDFGFTDEVCTHWRPIEL